MSRKLLMLLVLLVGSSSAVAHHPLDGMPMSTFVHGLLSGVAHPMIGIDHLFFVITVGIVACLSRSALLSPLFYLVGMLLGLTVVLLGYQAPFIELVVASSLIILGAIVISGYTITIAQSRSIFMFFGLFHGFAFAQSIVGAEAVSTTVLFGYLIGLCAIQWLVAVLAGYSASKAWVLFDSAALRPRVIGAVTFGVGLTFFIETTESMLLQFG